MNLAAKIRAAGESCGRMDGRLAVRKVKCQGCGEEICSDEDLTDVQYVKTKKRFGTVFPYRLYGKCVEARDLLKEDELCSRK